MQILHRGAFERLTFEPNSQPAPRGLTAHVSMSSGSDHMRSQNAPSCGISCLRSIIRIWSMVRTSGDNPPWTHSTFPSTTAARGHLGWQQQRAPRMGGTGKQERMAHEDEVAGYMIEAQARDFGPSDHAPHQPAPGRFLVGAYLSHDQPLVLHLVDGFFRGAIWRRRPC